MVETKNATRSNKANRPVQSCDVGEVEGEASQEVRPLLVVAVAEAVLGGRAAEQLLQTFTRRQVLDQLQELLGRRLCGLRSRSRRIFWL